MRFGYRAAALQDATVERSAPRRHAMRHCARHHSERCAVHFKRPGVDSSRDALGEVAGNGYSRCGEPTRELASGLHPVVACAARPHDRNDPSIEDVAWMLDRTA